MRNPLTSLAFLSSFSLFAGNSPNGFTENKGQIHDQFRKPNPSVLYLLNGTGMNVQLKSDGFAYDTYVPHPRPLSQGWGGNADLLDRSRGVDPVDRPDGATATTPTTYQFHRIDLRFVNGNPDAEIIADGRSEDYTNYYTDVTGEAGATFVYHYTTITYRNVWPNIDLRFNSGEEGFKYDVIVRPGGSLVDVRFEVKGAAISESLKGELVFTWNDGTMTELIPNSWAEVGRRRERVRAGYEVSDASTFGFQTQSVPAGTLVIDPMPLIWCTFYGGTSDDKSCGVGADAAHNSYLAGETASANAIATAGAYDNTVSASVDAFLVKFSDPGVRLWGTYFGGDANELSEGMTTDANGFSAIVGSTGSTSGIATAGTHQTLHTGNQHDGFVVTFNATGQRIWGTYLGGTDGTGILHDHINYAAIATNGAVGVAGWTTSTQGIATPGSDRPTGSGPFIAHFSATGQRTWGTYVSSTTSWAAGLTYAGTNRLVVTGNTVATAGIATNTAGRHDGTYNGGGDAFLMAYNTTNGTKAWGTYLGGAGSDQGMDVDYVALNQVVVSGRTMSTTGIATTGAHQTVYGGGDYDGFVVSFTSSNGTRTWGTYAGGALTEQLSSVDGTGTGSVCVAGLETPNQQTTSLGNAFCAQYATNGTRYMRPTLDDHLGDIAIAATGMGMWVSGNTYSATDVGPLSAHQPTFGGGTSDACLYHLHLAANPVGIVLSGEDEENTEVARITTIDKSLEIVSTAPDANVEGRMHATITDAQGRMIETAAWSASTSKRFDLSDHASGVYIVIIATNGQAVQAERFFIP